MIRINEFRFIIFFLLLFSMIITSPGCSSKKKNTSDNTSSQKTSNTNNDKDTQEEKNKSPAVIESLYEKSTILITFNATNSLFEDFSKYNMQLFDIMLNITPEGADESSPYLLYGESPLVDTDFLNTIPLDLTALSNDQYLLLDTFEVPPGKITSITLSLSGTTSTISVPSTNTYLVDPFFFNYQASDTRTPNNKLLPAQVTVNTDFSLSKDGFHVINFTIDKNMTAGLDPWYYEAETSKSLPEQHYLQFIPAISAQVLTDLTDTNILISGDRPFTLNGNEVDMGNLVIPVTTKDPEMAMDETTITELPVFTDETRVSLEANLSTVGSPSLSITKINLFSDHEKLSAYTDSTYTKQKSLWNKPDESWLVFRDTLNAPSKSTLGGASKTETDVTFELPKGKDANDNDVYWVCTKVLRYLTDASKPADCDTAKVESLILPLTDDNLKQFTLIETRRGQFEATEESATSQPLPALEFHPDINHHYTDPQLFYNTLEEKLGADYRVSAIKVKGTFANSVFTATGPVTVIVLAPQPLLDTMTEGWLANQAVTDVAKSGTPLAAIIGGALGGTAAVALVAGMAYLLYEKVKAKPKILASEWKGDDASGIKKLEYKSPLAIEAGTRVLANSVKPDDSDSVERYLKNTTIPNTALPDNIKIEEVDGKPILINSETNKKVGVVIAGTAQLTPPYTEELEKKFNANNAERELKRQGSAIGMSTAEFANESFEESTAAYLKQVADGEITDVATGMKVEKYNNYAAPLSDNDGKLFTAAADKVTKPGTMTVLEAEFDRISKLPADKRQTELTKLRLNTTSFNIDTDAYEKISSAHNNAKDLSAGKYKAELMKSIELRPTIPTKPTKPRK